MLSLTFLREKTLLSIHMDENCLMVLRSFCFSVSPSSASNAAAAVLLITLGPTVAPSPAHHALHLRFSVADLAVGLLLNAFPGLTVAPCAFLAFSSHDWIAGTTGPLSGLHPQHHVIPPYSPF